MYENLIVGISETDKEKILALAEEIGDVLAKYPYSNAPSSHFSTGMANAKNKFEELKKSITSLEVKQLIN